MKTLKNIHIDIYLEFKKRTNPLTNQQKEALGTRTTPLEE